MDPALPYVVKNQESLFRLVTKLLVVFSATPGAIKLCFEFSIFFLIELQLLCFGQFTNDA